MFAHQIVEDIAVWGMLIDKDSTKFILSKLNESIKISMGEGNKIHNMTRSNMYGKCVLFDSIYSRLPYNNCFFDYFYEITMVERVGVLAFKDKHKDYGDVIYFYIFSRIDKTGWFLMPNIFVSYYNKSLNSYELRTKKMFYYEFVSSADAFYTGCLTTVDMSLRLLNCKNIETQKIPAPEKLNKKRIKSGKQPLFDYHILNLVIPSNKKRGHKEQSAPLSHNRIHLCRGHFKEYTPEHPLFGKHTGLYWWEPSVRGQNKDGIVMKDYSAKTNERINANG